MDYWEDLDLENKITEILKDASNVSKGHLIGRPYLMAHQIAMEFSIRYPRETAQIGLRVAGHERTRKDSLPQYLAGELTRRIKAKRSAGKITHIEGGFLSEIYLWDIQFRIAGQKERVRPSMTNKNFSLSMFRLKE